MHQEENELLVPKTAPEESSRNRGQQVACHAGKPWQQPPFSGFPGFRAGMVFESIITTSTFLRRCCAKLQSREKHFGFRVSKDDLPAPRASRQAGRNEADGRHAAPGLGKMRTESHPETGLPCLSSSGVEMPEARLRQNEVAPCVNGRPVEVVSHGRGCGTASVARHLRYSFFQPEMWLVVPGPPVHPEPRGRPFPNKIHVLARVF